MDLTDAEIGELDDLLAAVPPPWEALDVTALDGFLCGVLAQPVAVTVDQWLPLVLDWNAGEAAPMTPDSPGWHAAKHERLATLAGRRLEALNRDLFGEGWFDPIVMQPLDEAGQPLQGREAIEAALGPWVMGFEHAQNHFTGLQELPHADVPDLLACLYRHLPAQNEEEQAYTKALDQEHPLKSLDAAIEDLVGNVVALAELGRAERIKVAPLRRDDAKQGRNEPCACGSGRKFKHCHGRTPKAEV